MCITGMECSWAVALAPAVSMRTHPSASRLHDDVIH
jgi:hypothetical protein